MQSDLLELSFEECLVCSDLHFPGHSLKWVRELIKYGRMHNIKKIIHAGDLFNFDALSRFELKDKKFPLDKELEVGKKVLLELRQHFNGFYTVRGNHDKRLPLAMNDSIDFATALNLLLDNKVVATNRDHLFLYSGGEKFRICHPDKYSTVKGKVAGGLAHDLQEHVIMGHPHYFSMSYNKTGRYMAIEMPCMCDKTAFQYKNEATTGCPEWNNGFLHIKKGKVKAITELTF